MGFGGINPVAPLMGRIFQGWALGDPTMWPQSWAFYNIAIASISTSMSLGSLAAWIVERAGNCPVKYVP
jgi:hypothetical protein